MVIYLFFFFFTFFNHDPAQNKTFLHILDNEPLKTFGSGQSSIMSEHKTKDCAVESLYSTSECLLFCVPFEVCRVS